MIKYQTEITDRAFKSVPINVVYDITKGRPRKPPYKTIDNSRLKEKVYNNKPIKDFNVIEKQTYNLYFIYIIYIILLILR